MYKILFFLAAILPAVITAQGNITVKSLIAYPDNDITALPVITDNRLTVEFDLQAADVPQLSFVFRFCDKNWIPTGNLFLANNGYNIFNNLDYDVLPVAVKEARYHFKRIFS